MAHIDLRFFPLVNLNFIFSTQASKRDQLSELRVEARSGTQGRASEQIRMQQWVKDNTIFN